MMDDGLMGWLGHLCAKDGSYCCRGFRTPSRGDLAISGGFSFDQLGTWLIHSVGWNTRAECMSKLKSPKNKNQGYGNGRSDSRLDCWSRNHRFRGT